MAAQLLLLHMTMTKLLEYEMQGIETEMITRIFHFLRAKLKPGFGIQVDVKAWNNQERFYDNLGFRLSTSQRRGVPMHICLTNQIELTDAVFKQGVFSMNPNLLGDQIKE